MLYPSGMATGEGSPGCKAPMSSMVALIALKSCKSLHLPDFFLNDKNRSVPGAIGGLSAIYLILLMDHSPFAASERLLYHQG